VGRASRGGSAGGGPRACLVIDNLLVRIHSTIVMIRWTGLAPWGFEWPFPGNLTSTFLTGCRSLVGPRTTAATTASTQKAHNLIVPPGAGISWGVRLAGAALVAGLALVLVRYDALCPRMRP